MNWATRKFFKKHFVFFSTRIKHMFDRLYRFEHFTPFFSSFDYPKYLTRYKFLPGIIVKKNFTPLYFWSWVRV